MVNPLLQRGYNGLKLLDLSTRRQQGPGANGVEKARIGGLGPLGFNLGYNNPSTRSLTLAAQDEEFYFHLTLRRT